MEIDKYIFYVFRSPKCKRECGVFMLAFVHLPLSIYDFQFFCFFSRFNSIRFIFSLYPIYFQGTENIERFSPTLNKYWRAPISTCHSKDALGKQEQSSWSQYDNNNIYVTEMATRRKPGADSAEVESMSLSGCTISNPSLLILLLQLLSYVFVIT